MSKESNNFWNEELSSGFYDEIYFEGVETQRGIRSLWHHLTFLKVSEYIESPNRHLDFACGPGTFLGNFSERNSVGVDISSNQINFAKKKYKKSNYYDLDEFDFSEYKESFKLITVLGLFEFINDDEIDELMKKFKYCLKKEGKIVVTTPNFSFTMEIMIKLLKLFTGVDYSGMYVNKFNKKKISEFKSKYIDFEIQDKKLLNIGVFFGIINFSFAKKIHKFIEAISQSRFGFLSIIVLEKR